MHRCLNISEILQAIADSLGEHNRAALLRMSLACRAFFDPAMDLLWATLREPDRLIRTLPGHTWSTEIVHGLPQLKIVKSPSASDWQRCAEYARRVRVLDCRHSGDAFFTLLDASLKTYPGAATQHSSGPQIFPNLHTLFLRWERQSQHFELLIAPPLRHLYVLSLHGDAIPGLIEALSSCSSALETLDIDTESGLIRQQIVAQGFYHVLTKLEKLVSLRAHIPCSKVVPHLALLSTLKELRLIDISATGTMSLPFPALEVLFISITNTTEHFLLPLLDRLGAPNLNELRIHYDIRLSWVADLRPAATQIHEVLARVSKFPRMRSFTLQGAELAPPPEDGHILSMAMLAPILSLRDLGTLEMRGFPVFLSSEESTAVARAWPRLQCLRISDKVPLTEPLKHRLLQADDLLPFARHCPALETLGLPLEIVETSIRIGAADLPPPSRINKLCVSGVADKVSQDMLELFTRVFPWADVRVPNNSAGDAIWDLSVRGDLTADDEDEGEDGDEGEGEHNEEWAEET